MTTQFFPALAQGTAATIIFKARELSIETLENLVNRFAEQFKKQSKLPDLFINECHVKSFLALASQKKDLLSLTDILTSELFESIKPEKPSLNPEQVNQIAARMIKVAKEFFSIPPFPEQYEQKLKEWYVGFATCILNETQIANEIEASEFLCSKYGFIERSVQESGLTQKDLDEIIGVATQALQTLGIQNVTAHRLLGEHFTFISQNPEALEFAEERLRNLRKSKLVLEEGTS